MENGRGKNVQGEKFLCFKLGSEEYGLPVLQVKEIVGMMEFAGVPQTHAYVRGVINLRGKIIPIIDLHMLFGMEYLPYHERTCIVIVEGKQEGRNVAMGMVVDSMTEVTAFAPEAIEPPEELPQSNCAPYILGLGKTGAGIKILLDAEKLIEGTELVKLA
mgnify:FL=1